MTTQWALWKNIINAEAGITLNNIYICTHTFHKTAIKV